MVDNTFIQTYRGLVHWVYFKLIPKNPLIESYKEDIIQEGFIGLMKASKSVQPNSSATEVTYFRKAIYNSMITYINKYIYKEPDKISIDSELFNDDECKKTIESTLIDDSQALDNFVIDDIIKCIKDYYKKHPRCGNVKQCNLKKIENIKIILEQLAEGKTYREIAQYFNVSFQRIDQVMSDIKNILKESNFYKT